MKKLFYVFSALIVALTSCSGDSDSTAENPGPTLLKKTIETDADGIKLTTNYTYNGTKLASIIDNNAKRYFTYTGNLITKIEYRDMINNLVQEERYEYNEEGKLITYKRIDPEMNSGDKEVYAYNEDGNIFLNHYTGNASSQTTFNNNGDISFFENGEIRRIYTYTPGISTTTDVYTYDMANGAMMNVLGYGKTAFVDATADAINHNILTQVSAGHGTTTTVYTYNADNYPAVAAKTFNGETVTTEYFYE